MDQKTDQAMKSIPVGNWLYQIIQPDIRNGLQPREGVHFSIILTANDVAFSYDLSLAVITPGEQGDFVWSHKFQDCLDMDAIFRPIERVEVPTSPLGKMIDPRLDMERYVMELALVQVIREGKLTLHISDTGTEDFDPEDPPGDDYMILFILRGEGINVEQLLPPRVCEIYFKNKPTWTHDAPWNRD